MTIKIAADKQVRKYIAHTVPGCIPVALIDALTEHIADRYSGLSDNERLIIAAWIIHTYFYQHLDSTTYLHIASHTSNSGKSTIGRILRDLCNGAVMDSPTVATLSTFKGPDKHTLIMDEIHLLMSDKRGGLIADFSRLICLGNVPGNVWSVSGAKPGDRDERDPYFPKAFIGIGLDMLNGPISERGIRVTVKPGSTADQIERERRQKIRPVKATVFALRSWIEDIAESQAIIDALIAGIESAESRQLNDGSDDLINRDADIWRPLIVIADLVSSEHGKRMREAISEYIGSEPEPVQTIADQIDLALKHLFRTKKLLAFNWYHGPRARPLPENAEYPMSNDDFGWAGNSRPRNPQRDRLPECSLIINASLMEAELRFKATEFPAICAALGIKMSAKDVRNAYADAKRLHVQSGHSSIPLAFYKGQKEIRLIGIDISGWLWPEQDGADLSKRTINRLIKGSNDDPWKDDK